MPKTTKKQTPHSSVPAPRSQWDDPFKSFGDAATQLTLKIPVVKIEYLASTATKQEHPDWQRGKFSINTGDQLDQLEVGLLGIRFGRVKWPNEYDPNNPDEVPECKSDNGIFPTPSISTPLTDVSAEIRGEKVPVCVHCDANGAPQRNRTGRYLAACAFAKWGAKGQPPVCKESFTMLLWEHTLNLPLIFSVKGTGVKHLNQLHMDMIRATRNLPEKLPYPPGAYIRIIITARAVSQWYEPIFNIGEPFDELGASINADAKKDLIDDFESMSSDDFSFDKQQEED